MPVNKKRLRIFIPSAILVVTLLVSLNVFSKIDNWDRDWTQNSATLQANAADPDLQVLMIPGYWDHIVDWMEEWAEDTPGWSHVETKSGDGWAEVHLVHTTTIMRFRDDVHVTLMTVEYGTQIDATSESRIGKGDLGQNPRNLKQLVRALKQAEFIDSRPKIELYEEQP